MRSNRMRQIKTYSKIMKIKRETGQIQEICMSSLNTEQKPQIQEEESYDQLPPNQEFEDEFQDEYQEQEGWISDHEISDQQPPEESGTMISQTTNNLIQSISKDSKVQKKKNEVFLGNNKKLEEGEVLQFDNKAYDMLHRLSCQWPSLSIDFICRDSPFENLDLGFKQMNKYPYEVYTVQGSSNNTKNNSIYLTRWSKLHKTKYDDDPDEQDSEDDEIMNDEEAEVTVQQIETSYSVNRIKSLKNSPIISFWNEKGEIHLMDLSEKMEKLKNGVGSKKKGQCKQIVLQSQSEGFALNWNNLQVGQLGTGNNLGQIQIFTNDQTFTSWKKTSQYTYHKSSVEDIMFSPEQAFVFASCSSDGTIQLVDMRTHTYNKSQLKINAHTKDVNVFDWNKMATHLIVSGSDDCTVKVWDLRMHKQNSKHAEQLICFNWHTEPITSIKFQPNEESVIAVASQDNRLTIWDMSMENENQDKEFPNQLMFLHQGQEQIKEICYHPVYFQMLVSSANDGINIFKPSLSLPQESQQQDDEQDLKKPPIKQQDLDQYLGRMNLN